METNFSFLESKKEYELFAGACIDAECILALCQAVNNPNKSSVGNILFAWNDTKLVRKNNSQLIVILNDQNNVSRGIEEAFTNYDVKVVPWSQRNASENLALFAAG